MKPNPPGVMEKNNKLMMKMDKDRESKRKKMASKMKREPFFGLPHGEKDTPQLRKRFKNYIAHMEKHGGLGYLDKQNGHKLLRDNSFYEFNKKEYD